MQQGLPNREHCTGCAACYNVCTHGAISMKEDHEGFLIPHVDEKICADCGLCVRKCPVINIPSCNEIDKKIYAAYNLNKEQHQKSASGGLFSAFANWFYQQQNGLVCASAFDNSLKLKFYISSSKVDLIKLRGSKYVQSEVGFIYRDIKKRLLDGNQVFFLGTPCQVAGLRSFLGKEYDNLFTIDLVCHGVPSPKLFSSYLESIGVTTNHDYENYYFRNQKNPVYFTSAVKRNGEKLKEIPRNQHSYVCAYLKGWIHRESCYNCPFTGDHRQGDCTIADFWGILAGKVPFGGNTSMGVSMLMVNTAKGENVFNQIKNQLYYEEKTMADAIVDNHNLIHPDIRPQERNIMYQELLSLSPEDYMEKYNCKLFVPLSLGYRIIRKLKNIFSV